MEIKKISEKNIQLKEIDNGIEYGSAEFRTMPDNFYEETLKFIKELEKILPDELDHPYDGDDFGLLEQYIKVIDHFNTIIHLRSSKIRIYYHKMSDEDFNELLPQEKRLVDDISEATDSFKNMMKKNPSSYTEEEFEKQKEDEENEEEKTSDKPEMMIKTSDSPRAFGITKKQLEAVLVFAKETEGSFKAKEVTRYYRKNHTESKYWTTVPQRIRASLRYCVKNEWLESEGHRGETKKYCASDKTQQGLHEIDPGKYELDYELDPLNDFRVNEGTFKEVRE